MDNPDKLATQDTGRRPTKQWTIQINWERKTQDDDQKTKKQKKIESFECNMWSKTCGARHVNPFGTSPVFDEVCASHRFTLIVFCCCFFKTFFFIFWARVCLSIIDYDIRYCLSSHCILCLMPSSTRIKK
jgi:hypothetical protein